MEVKDVLGGGKWKCKNIKFLFFMKKKLIDNVLN